MTINTNNIRMPAVRMTAGAAAESYNRAASEGQEKVDNVRITLAKSLGIAESELGGGTVAAATQKARDILLNYGNPRSQWDMASIALDVFAVMNLLQTVAQSLRNAMREMRKMELQVEQASIRSQASMEKDAAITQAIGGGITFLVQVGVTLGGTYNQIKAISKEMTANAAQGIDVAKQQADLALLGDSKEAIGNQVSKLGDSPAVKQDNLGTTLDVAEKNESVQAKLGESKTACEQALNEAKKNAAGELQAARQEVASATEAQTKAQGKANEARQKLDVLEHPQDNGPVDQSKVNQAKAELKGAEEALGKANTRLQTAKDALEATQAASEGTFKDLQSAKDKVQAATDSKQLADAEVDKARTALEAAQHPAEGVPVDEAKVTEARNRLTTAEQKQTEAGNNLTTAQEELRALEGNNKLRNPPPELEKTQNELRQAELEAQGMEKMAKNLGAATVEDVAARCQSDYDALLAKANGERSVNGKISPETAGALKDAGDRLVYARARQIQHYQNQPDGAAKVNALSDRLSASLQTKLNAANIDKGAMTKALVYGQMTMQLSQELGKLGESLTNMFAALKHAKATAMQADQKQAEMHVGELTEMLQQMMTTVEKAIEMYQAVVQRDSQTIDEITGAIRS